MTPLRRGSPRESTISVVSGPTGPSLRAYEVALSSNVPQTLFVKGTILWIRNV